MKPSEWTRCQKRETEIQKITNILLLVKEVGKGQQGNQKVDLTKITSETYHLQCILMKNEFTYL